MLPLLSPVVQLGSAKGFTRATLRAGRRSLRYLSAERETESEDRWPHIMVPESKHLVSKKRIYAFLSAFILTIRDPFFYIFGEGCVVKKILTCERMWAPHAKHSSMGECPFSWILTFRNFRCLDFSHTRLRVTLAQPSGQLGMPKASQGQHSAQVVNY